MSTIRSNSTRKLNLSQCYLSLMNNWMLAKRSLRLRREALLASPTTIIQNFSRSLQKSSTFQRITSMTSSCRYWKGRSSGASSDISYPVAYTILSPALSVDWTMNSSFLHAWIIWCQRKLRILAFLAMRDDARLRRFCAVEAICESVSTENFARVEASRAGQVNGTFRTLHSNRNTDKGPYLSVIACFNHEEVCV